MINDAFQIQNQVAFITGAGKGIGRQTALTFAQAGAHIVLAVKDRESTQDLINEIEKIGKQALTVKLDVSQTNQIESAVQTAIDHFGRIDILVNNAGISPPNSAIDVTEADFDQTVAVNLKGTFFTSQAVAKQMIKQSYGRIINVSSQAGFIALDTESVYCMTKAGISHLTKCLALEWAKHGIQVNAVAPTFIKTPGTQKWLTDNAFMQSVIDRIPLGHVGEPEDVALPMLFLASKAANMITGETLMIDGGWTIQ